MQRHVVTICQMETFTFSVDAAECRRSSAVDKSLWHCKGSENKFGWSLRVLIKISCNLHAAL